MPSLKDIRGRIGSVRNIAQITRAIIIVKATALASLVAVGDLTGEAVRAMSITYNPFPFLAVAGIGWLAPPNVAAGVWASSFIAAGYFFSQASEAALGKGAKIFGFGALLVFIAVVWYLLRRIKAKVAAHALAHPHPPLPARGHPPAQGLAAAEPRDKSS